MYGGMLLFCPEEKGNKYLATQLEKGGGNGLESTDSIVPMKTLPEKDHL